MFWMKKAADMGDEQAKIEYYQLLERNDNSNFEEDLLKYARLESEKGNLEFRGRLGDYIAMV